MSDSFNILLLLLCGVALIHSVYKDHRVTAAVFLVIMLMNMYLDILTHIYRIRP